MLEPNNIYLGDCLDLLKQLDDESIHCCVTSPPFWGLRDYGLDPIIWDAVDMCEHEWDVSKAIITGNAPSNSTTLTGGMGIRDSGIMASQGQFCSLCGAWRGQLGLEPTFQLYIQHLMWERQNTTNRREDRYYRQIPRRHPRTLCNRHD